MASFWENIWADGSNLDVYVSLPGGADHAFMGHTSHPFNKGAAELVDREPSTSSPTISDPPATAKEPIHP